MFWKFEHKKIAKWILKIARKCDTLWGIHSGINNFTVVGPLIWCDNPQVRMSKILYININNNNFHHLGRSQMCAGGCYVFRTSKPHSGTLWLAKILKASCHFDCCVNIPILHQLLPCLNAGQVGAFSGHCKTLLMFVDSSSVQATAVTRHLWPSEPRTLTSEQHNLCSARRWFTGAQRCVHTCHPTWAFGVRSKNN